MKLKKINIVRNTKILNSVGLILGMVGGIFIFIWGPPQPVLESGISIGIEESTIIPETDITVAEHNETIENKRKRHLVFSKIGLSLIIVGFGFQLFSIWSD